MKQSHPPHPLRQGSHICVTPVPSDETASGQLLEGIYLRWTFKVATNLNVTPLHEQPNVRPQISCFPHSISREGDASRLILAGPERGLRVPAAAQPHTRRPLTCACPHLFPIALCLHCQCAADPTGRHSKLPTCGVVTCRIITGPP